MLGTIFANLKNRQIELRRPATDDETVDVLRKGIKTGGSRSSSTEGRPARTRGRRGGADQRAGGVSSAAADPAEIRTAVRSRHRGRAPGISAR